MAFDEWEEERVDWGQDNLYAVEVRPGCFAGAGLHWCAGGAAVRAWERVMGLPPDERSAGGERVLDEFRRMGRNGHGGAWLPWAVVGAELALAGTDRLETIREMARRELEAGVTTRLQYAGTDACDRLTPGV